MYTFCTQKVHIVRMAHTQPCARGNALESRVIIRVIRALMSAQPLAQYAETFEEVAQGDGAEQYAAYVVAHACYRAFTIGKQ